MFLIDDLFLAPAYGVLWLAGKIREEASRRIVEEAERLATELGELYRGLEGGGLSESEFERRERELLARLDWVETQRSLLGPAEAE